MRTRIGNRLRVSLIVLLTVFSLSSTMVPTTALDLGAKAKYIISVTPSAKAAIEAAVLFSLFAIFILKPFKELIKHPLVPGEDEIRLNSRARSAKLRIAVKND